ncbi:hypothetical protein AVEN_134791-1 [Araneus ventricosus]|uniref:Uncharacterized protein n=1 Tax=Araneus ventricosus TaxID=182803 RepID=A0A4Y2GA25_ARAVE|nr:hypothetical protein AVEN_134791-1 [Araneus ventricosus]
MEKTSPIVATAAFSTRNGVTKCFIVFIIAFNNKKMIKYICRRIVCYFSLPTKGTLYGMTHAKAMKTSGPRRHRPPSSRTRKGSYQLWELPASTLTMGLSGIYTFRVTSRNVDQP